MAIVNIDLPDDKNLVIQDKPKKAKIPPFSAIGRLGMTNNKIQGFDTAELLKNLSSTAHWLFWTMDQQRDRKTNIVSFDSGICDPSTTRRIQRGLKELISKNVVIRLKRSQGFLINPKVLLPVFDDYENIWSVWLRHGGN